MDDNFRIDFETPSSVYHAGQTVAGRVFLNLQGKPTKKFKAVRIVSTGESTADLKKYEIFWTSSEKYFKYNLFRSQVEEGLPRGVDTEDVYLYPFSLTLPTTIPPSYEGQHGYVRYRVLATVEWAWKCNWNTEKVFLVVNPSDVNAEMKAKVEPIYQEVVKSLKARVEQHAYQDLEKMREDRKCQEEE
uniref:Arrestin domain-containing protein 2 n=1 Tax=Cacopsylla melanoneura TaxID=428564 RepID=A0A8D8Z0T2_9HEMI